MYMYKIKIIVIITNETSRQNKKEEILDICYVFC